MLSTLFKKRFDELATEAGKLPLHDSGGAGLYVPSGVWERWATSVQNLLLKIFGSEAPHYVNFVIAFKDCRGHEDDIDTLKGIFLSAKDDFEGGYVFNVDLRVSGEVFGDFIAMAKQSLSDGYKDVAAVLACAALEDTLKRLATANGLDVADRSMQDVVAAQNPKGLFLEHKNHFWT